MMQTKTQISNSMLFVIIINMVYAKAIGVTQGILARQAGGDMWLVTIFSMCIGIFFMWLTIVIIRRAPEKNIFEQTKLILGPWGERVIALAVFLFFLGAYGGVMITIVFHLMDYFLPDMPAFVFVMATTLVGVYAIFKGVEVIARLAILGVFSIIVLNVLLMLGSVADFEIYQFLPVLRNGFFNAVEVTQHHNADWSMAIMMVAIILPMVKQQEKWSKYSLRAAIFGGLLVVMWPILEVGVLSPEVSGQYIVSCMQMARSAEIGLFIHRYELIMVIFFSLSALVQVSMCLLCASISLKHVVPTENLHMLFFPVATILGFFGYWVISNHLRAMDLLTYYWPKVALVLGFGVLLLLNCLGLIFKKKLIAK